MGAGGGHSIPAPWPWGDPPDSGCRCWGRRRGGSPNPPTEHSQTPGLLRSSSGVPPAPHGQEGGPPPPDFKRGALHTPWARESPPAPHGKQRGALSIPMDQRGALSTPISRGGGAPSTARSKEGHTAPCGQERGAEQRFEGWDPPRTTRETEGPPPRAPVSREGRSAPCGKERGAQHPCFKGGGVPGNWGGGRAAPTCRRGR